MRIIKTARYDDIAQDYIGECPVGSVKRILEEEGEAADEKFLADKGIEYGDARACIRALKADSHNKIKTAKYNDNVLNEWWHDDDESGTLNPVPGMPYTDFYNIIGTNRIPGHSYEKFTNILEEKGWDGIPIVKSILQQSGIDDQKINAGIEFLKKQIHVTNVTFNSDGSHSMNTIDFRDQEEQEANPQSNFIFPGPKRSNY